MGDFNTHGTAPLFKVTVTADLAPVQRPYCVRVRVQRGGAEFWRLRGVLCESLTTIRSDATAEIAEGAEIPSLVWLGAALDRFGEFGRITRLRFEKVHPVRHHLMDDAACSQRAAGK